MKQKIIVAPELGTLEQATAAFQTARPPYYRGGGDSITPEFERALNHYLGGTHAVVTASGQAANMAVFSALLAPGTKGHALVSNRLFGTTKQGLLDEFRDAGHEITFFDTENCGNLEAQIQDNTKFIFTEVSSNPEGVVADLDNLRRIAVQHQVPLVLDHTLTAGFAGFNPFQYADIVTASLAKQTGGGNNRATGGVVLLDDHYNWNANQTKFGNFARKFTIGGHVKLPLQPFGALVRKMATVAGTCVAPLSAAQDIMDSLPGLKQRVTVMRDNACELAQFFQTHPGIENVRLAGLDNSENSQRARSYLGGNGFVIFIDVKGGCDGVAKFIGCINQSGVSVDHGTLEAYHNPALSPYSISHSVQLGQKQTAVTVPGVTTNRQASDDELAARGMGRHSVRISVGIEPAKYLKQLFDLALG